MALTAQPLGNTGGYSYLYLVNNTENKLIQVGEIDKPEWRESRRRVYSADGVSPPLHGIGCGGNTEPKIIEPEI